MDSIRQDLRYAFRLLIKNPMFAAIAIVTLAIGIGANTAIFSVVQAALLRPLPYRDVDRLVYLSETNPRDGSRIRQASYPDFLDWKKATGFAGIAGYTSSSYFVGTEQPERVLAAGITANFFQVLGVPLNSGRHFTEAEENGEGRVAIITYGYWQRRFGSDAGALGQTFTLNTVRYTVVGVLPAGFHFAPVGAAEIWVPLNPSPILRERRFTHWLSVIARLKDDVTMDSAQPELTAIGARIADLDKQFHANSSVRSGLLSESILGRVRPVLLGLFVAVGLVLLIACANVANLVLARSAGRQREIAIRVAVGADRGRLAQQLLTETLLLSIIGGAIGIALAPRCAAILIAGIPQNQLNSMPFLMGGGINTSVLLFAAATIVLTGLICGLLPALQAPATNIRSAIAPARRVLRNGLVVGEVALALVLLVSAGLLTKSMARLLKVDPGFDSTNLLTLRLSLLSDRYRDAPQREAYFRRIAGSIDSLPGVQGTTGVDVLPLSGGGNTGIPTLEGTAAPVEFSANVRTIFPNYFQVMGIPLVDGRAFSDQDSANSPRVVTVNQGFVSRAFPGQNPLGRRMSFAFVPNTQFEIVGVVGDENVTGLDAARNPVIYFAYAQGAPSSMNLITRTASNPNSVSGPIRAAISDVDPGVPVYGVRTMDEIISISPFTFSRRYPATLIGILAGVALVLASIGIYGVIAYSVTQRTRELGVRIALGASRSQVFKLVIKEGSLLSILGILIGLGVAIGITRFMSGLLFGVTATDPSVFGTVAAVFLAVTLLACYIPARRATRIDPLVALRNE